MNLPILVALVATASPAPRPAGDAAEAFARLRLLQGTWKGTYAFSSAQARSGSMTATYRVTGNGSAVIEDLGDGVRPSMTSAYHLDGGDLRMTHYCAAGNQPRLKAATIDLAKNVIRFDFVDITNLAAPDAAHVRGLTMRLLDKDHLELEFTFGGKGSGAVERISLMRVAST